MRHHRVRSDREGWREGGEGGGKRGRRGEGGRGGREGGRERARELVSSVYCPCSQVSVSGPLLGSWRPCLTKLGVATPSPPCLSCLLCMLAILIFPFLKFEEFDLLVYYRGWPASLPYIRENPHFRCNTHSIQNPCSQKGTYGQNMSVLKNDQTRIT